MTEWYLQPAQEPDEDIRAQAQERQDNLTKPKGSLGKLEAVAVQLSAAQRTLTPCVEKPLIVVFAGDHGVTVEGVSAYPQTVTAEMVRNFAEGGAAISVLAKSMGVEFKVVNVGTVYAIEDLPNVIDIRTLGIVAGIELEPRAGEPGRRGYEAMVAAYKAGLMIRITADIIALSPPLILNKADIDKAMTIVARVLKSLN